MSIALVHFGWILLLISPSAVEYLVLVGSDLNTLADVHWYLAVFVCMVYVRYDF